jgi:hypothetical protein
MSEPMLWPTIAWGLASFVVFYIGAVLIERRDVRQHRVHLRSRLLHPLSRLGTIAAGKLDQRESVSVDTDLPAKPRRLLDKIAAVVAFDEIVIGLRETVASAETRKSAAQLWRERRGFWRLL